MPDATFDGPNRLIQLATTGTFDVERNLYSAWKEWVQLSDNAKFPVAFDTTGGDDIGGGQQIAPYFFIRNDNGWRIRAPEADGETILQGNAFPRDPAQALFVQASGFDAFIRQEVSTRAVVVETGVSGLTAEESDLLAQAAAGGGGGGEPVADTPTLFIEEWGGTTITAQGKAGTAPKHRIAKTQITLSGVSQRTAFDFAEETEFLVITANARTQFEIGDDTVTASSTSYYLASGETRFIGIEAGDTRIAAINSQIT